MGGTQSTVTKNTQEIRNEMLSRSDSNCHADCSQTQTGNLVVIKGEVENIEISQKCKAQASCVIYQSTEMGVDSMVENITNNDQDYQSSIFSFSWNSQRSETENETLLHNKLTNIMTATCRSSVSQLQSDNIIYVEGVVKNFALTQEGDSTSNCTIDNIAKMTAYNKIVNETDQNQARKSALGGLIGGIICLIIVGVIMLILMIMFTGVVEAASDGGGSSGSSGISKSSGGDYLTTKQKVKLAKIAVTKKP